MLIAGAIGAAIGSGKGRTLEGFILGAFLSLIGWIIVALEPPNYKNMGKIQCPFCKEYIDKNALVCPHCQREIVSFGPLNTASTPAPKPEEKERTYFQEKERTYFLRPNESKQKTVTTQLFACPVCGAKLDPEVAKGNFCPYCGAKLRS